uniref:Peroxidasin n=2 Tax=Ascaris TaxID=6251 RepID=F1KRF1_ASCSU
MEWLWLSIVALFIVQLNELLACPKECECEDGKMRCRGRDLHRIPTLIPTDTSYIDLRDNHIKRLSRNDLRNLSNLRTLLLGNNRIELIDENILDVAPKLQKLTLSRNYIKWLPNLSSGRANDLMYFDAHANRLEALGASVFRHSPYLHTINLAANNLQTLPDGTFDNLKHLRMVHLEENPINCDCRWQKQLQYLQGHISESPRCFNPIWMRDKRLLDIEQANLRCYKAAISVNAGRILLHCSHKGNTITWLYRGHDMKRSYSGDYELFLNGTLRIDEIGDIQYFECAVDHTVLPQRKRRQAYGLSAPQFTLKPKDRTHREGAPIRIDCEVTGKPRPTIKWYFNGTELKSSRKHEMNFERTNLVIYPFLERDVGIYSCVAENKFGRIEASASIELIASSPPLIIEPPESQIVEEGSTVTLRCKANAEPRPTITWFFDGSVIPMLRGHFHVSDDETELTISYVTKHDDGTYSCMAGNTVGSMTADARLSVTSHHHKNDNQITDDVIREAVREASYNVDRAVEETRKRLSKTTSPRELMSWIRLSVPQSVELNRAREIYEESIRLVQKHVEKGLSLPLNELPSNVSFASVLAQSHVDLLTQLAGCSGTQTSDPCNDHCFHSRYRTYDGQCNNEVHTMWGASYTRFRRLLLPIYENGFNTPVGWDPDRLYFGFRKPNPRVVSRKLLRASSITPHEIYSAMLMQWGQFIDHDLDFTATAISRNAFATGAICNRTCENTNPCFNIQLPYDDPRMRTKPKYPCIEFERSSAVCGSGETSLIYRRITYREQMNIITSFIDASGVYGSTEEDAYELRDLHPDRGLLRFDIVSDAHKPYLPFERDSAMDCRRNRSIDNPIRCFLAGDYRANEQLGLMSMHTIFMREHNRLAIHIANLNPQLDGETIFQEARKIVGAEMQHITYYHWLPKVLGKEGFRRLVGEYRGYQRELDPSISNAFATAAFRFGHTIINPVLYRLNADFKPTRDGHVSLRDAFFAPETLLAGGGIDPILRGLFGSPMKKPLARELLNKELTEQLFNRAHDVALDLASLNIQRGRDHALPGYTEFRKWCNLSPIERWSDLNDVMPQDVIQKLKELYGHPGNIDLYAGGVAEKRVGGALIGPTFSCIIAEQFNRVRDGDRFWYENEGVFTNAQLREIKKVTLARILCDNGDNIDRIQEDVFEYPGKEKSGYGVCSNLPFMDLSPWRSCCDRLCSIANNRYRIVNRRRRSRKQDCEWSGTFIKEGIRWQNDCSECECKDGEVWCRTIDHC